MIRTLAITAAALTVVTALVGMVRAWKRRNGDETIDALIAKKGATAREGMTTHDPKLRERTEARRREADERRKEAAQIETTPVAPWPPAARRGHR